MRFEIEGDSPAITKIASRVDDDGDVRISASDVTLLWIRKNGTVLLAEAGDELRRLGFQVDTATDAVTITN